MEKIIWIDRVTNEEVLHRVKEKRINLDTIKKKECLLDWAHLLWKLTSKIL
jgi:hypothetical protein